LDGAGKAGVELDPVENQHPGAFKAVAVHPDVSGFDRANPHALHAGADSHAGGLGSQSEGLDHGLLTLRGGAVVGAHARDQKRPCAVAAKPVPGGLGDFNEVADSATARGDCHLPARRGKVHAVEGLADRGGDIGQGGRNKLLVDGKEFHVFDP